MARRTAWCAALLAVATLIPLEARARDPYPVLELGYDGLIMAGDEVKFQDPLYGGSLGLMLYMTTKHPILMRIRANVQGAGWTDVSGKKGSRLVSGLKWNVGMGIGRGRHVLPFVEVGLGPQFLTIYRKGSKKVASWAWTVGLEGQLGFVFRIKKMFGIKLGVGFTSLSFYSRKENLGGFWLTASFLLGIPGGGYEPPPPPPPPTPGHPQPRAGGFYFDAWITNVGGDGTRPVLSARLNRQAGFDAEVPVWVELDDGSEFEMNRAGLEDPDLYELPLYILGLECGQHTVTVTGKSGWETQTYPVNVYLPCPVMPEGT
jgi:hypothetical protein